MNSATVESKIKKRNFCVGSLNVRGLTAKTKQEALTRDTQKYNVDVCCLQETKIQKNGVYEINGSIIITFETKNKHYGNGFIVSKTWKGSIYKYWKVSDRICVLQLTTKAITADSKQYKCEQTNETRVKISKINTNERFKVEKISDLRIKIKKAKPKYTVNIINVYAPTSDRAKKQPNELQKFYKDLCKLCKELDNEKTSITLIAGDFNAKVGKRNELETCIGS